MILPFKFKLFALLAGIIFALSNSLGAQNSHGVNDNRILFGQSAVFSGPASELGLNLKTGIEVAFDEANQKGGVFGRRLVLEAKDDFYEPNQAVENTRDFINETQVFGLIGPVGTPTARVTAPIAEESGIPFIAPFSGAGFLRDREMFKSVVNLRASYQQEINSMIERLTQDRGISSIAVLYQNDSFGRVGYNGTLNALKIYGLELVGRSVYLRNTTAVKTALYDLKIKQPDAVIVVGSYEPVAEAIKWANKIDFNPVFMTISFVGANALASALGDQSYQDVYMTQVVPDFNDTSLEIANEYRKAMLQFDPGKDYGFGSFEGYLTGRLVVEAFKSCEDDLTRTCFLDNFRQTNVISVADIDFIFGEFDNQALDDVYLTQFRVGSGFTPVRSLNDN